MNTLSAVTLPNCLAKVVLSSEMSFSISFLNCSPLWILTFAFTLVAITGMESILANYYVNVVGLTLSTTPPEASANLLRESMLHSSPSIDTILIVTPDVWAIYPTVS